MSVKYPLLRRDLDATRRPRNHLISVSLTFCISALVLGFELRPDMHLMAFLRQLNLLLAFCQCAFLIFTDLAVAMRAADALFEQG